MKQPKHDRKLVLQLHALRDMIDDILDGGGGEISEKPAPATRSRGGATRGPGARGTRKLAIVVGHTALRPGASSLSPMSASEYPWNKDLAEKIVSECSALGANAAVFFRDNGGIAAAYSGAAASGAKAVIELHFNNDGGAARGTETLYGTACAASEDWAQRVQDSMVALYGRTGTLDRKLKRTPPHPRGSDSVNALSTIPSCLIEPFFGDNASDAALGHTKKDALAKALATAFVAHFP